jgi:hypothetical protein
MVTVGTVSSPPVISRTRAAPSVSFQMLISRTVSRALRTCLRRRMQYGQYGRQ